MRADFIIPAVSVAAWLIFEAVKRFYPMEMDKNDLTSMHGVDTADPHCDDDADCDVD